MKNSLSVTEPGKYFGIGKNRNLIVIQVESLQNFVVNKKYGDTEITPNLNYLINNDSFYFPNYYQQLGLGNTSDAEFITNNSIYPTTEGQAYSLYQNNEFYGLPWQLRRLVIKPWLCTAMIKASGTGIKLIQHRVLIQFYDETYQ